MKLGIIGPGFLGTIIKWRFKKNHEVVLFGRNDSLKTINDFDLIIICVAPRSKEEYEACYVGTCQNVISHLKKPIPIIYTSSTSVYGPKNGQLVDETSIAEPKNAGQKILLDAEQIILKNPLTTVLRLGEIYGYMRDIASRVINTSCFPSDGSNIANIIHVDDIVGAIHYIYANKLFGLYNLVSDTHSTRKELYTYIANALNLPAPKFDPHLPQMHGDNKLVSNEKIKKSGYLFKYPHYEVPLTAAFSFCPNDTFLFYPLISGIIESDVNIMPILGDVEFLNMQAESSTYPITKLSFYALSKLSQYINLEVGNALGHGVGPKVVAKNNFTAHQIKDLKIAIPGKNTTANLLTKIFIRPKNVVYCTYDQIFDLLSKGQVDLGVIIHEQRFCFKDAGFKEIMDLGNKWEEETRLPLPLGCIAVKKSLGPLLYQKINEALKKSLEFALEHPESCMEYILKNAQVKNEQIVRDHINLYINQETAKLSNQGKRAIDLLNSFAITYK